MTTLSSILPPVSLTSVSGTLPVTNGGTGATTLTGVLKGDGTSAFTAGAVALGSEVSGTLPVANGGTGETTLTANNVLLGNGTSALQSVAPGAAGNILTSDGTTWTSATPAPSGPTLTAIASGSLSDGSRVIVNANGTVSVVAAIPQTVGTPTVFNSAGNDNGYSATYDGAAQKVVIVFRNNAGSGLAIVGTVSGTSISFGSPVTFVANVGNYAVTYDANAQKIVIVFQDLLASSFICGIVGTVSGTSISFGASTGGIFSGTSPRIVYDSSTQKVVIAFINDINGFGRAAVGTVSGTNISFGTDVVFHASNTQSPSLAYDSVAQRVVIAYVGGSNFGTALVGTVSGTSISYGTPVVFNSASTNFTSAAYDSVAQRVVIAYSNVGNSSFGTAIVGTVSGTSISFGAAVVFNSADTRNTSSTYDAAARNVVIAYSNMANSGFGTIAVGTVSGTSISFGTPVVFVSGDTSIRAIGSTYDANAQKVVVAYRNQSNSAAGTATVFQTASTTLTAQNFIGFSDAAYTNGQTATIQIVGSVDDAQSGLTPGQSYFVQGNGTLGLTPGTPSVFAGTAVAANRIIVKG